MKRIRLRRDLAVRTGWTLGILAGLVLTLAAWAAEQPGAAGTDMKEEAIRDLSARTFAGVKDALGAGNETLAREIVERAVRLAWNRTAPPRAEPAGNSAVPEAAEPPAAAPDPVPVAEAAKPPLRINDLLAAAREYLAAPAGETQAARQIRQMKILDGLTGRELTMRAALYTLKPMKKPGEFRAEFWSKAGPSETIILRFVSTDDSLVALAVGREKTVRLNITGLSFGVTYKGGRARAAPWPGDESIGMFEPESSGRAGNATGTAFIVEGTDAQLTR